jgi:hypothetical protein
MKSSLFTLVPLLCLAACGAPEPQQAAPLADITQSDTTTGSPPTLTFGQNWTVALAGQPNVGGPLRIVYDVSRLPQCRGASWAITGYTMTNHGPIQSFTLANASTVGSVAETQLNLTTGGDLEIWFQVTDSTGCNAWDSNLGWNFHTKVWQDPTLTFKTDWTQSLYGTLRGGSTLMVDYDIGRLPQCRAMYMNYNSWDVSVHYRFDGGAENFALLTLGYGEFNSQYQRQVPAFIPVPVGAHTLEMWFVNGDRKGCVTYDSQYGQNYIFSVQ